MCDKSLWYKRALSHSKWCMSSCFQLCVCVCNMHVCTWHAYEYLWRPEVKVIFFIILQHTFKNRVSLDKELTIQLLYQPTRPRHLSVMPSSNTEITGMWCCFWLLIHYITWKFVSSIYGLRCLMKCVYWGSKLRSPHMCSKHLTTEQFPQNPSTYYFGLSSVIG